MYVIWSHGDELLDFTLPIPTVMLQMNNDHNNEHGHSNNHPKNVVMVQLLRADKLEIPEG